MASAAAHTARIAVIYHSTYGHVRKLADAVIEGLKAQPGVSVELMRVQETLSDDILEKMHAKGLPHNTGIPVVDVSALPSYDGFIFGTPTRFGVMSAQMKAMWDATGQHWQKGALQGKPAGVLFSTATQAGGQETTALTFFTQMVHHGMVIVPMGYINPKQFSMDVPHGGSPYGPGTLAGPDGSRQPSELELEVARDYGKKFARIAVTLATGGDQATKAAGEKEGPGREVPQYTDKA